MRLCPGRIAAFVETVTRRTLRYLFTAIPGAKDRREEWFHVFQICEDDVKLHMQVCSRHFPDGDASKRPNPSLGNQFAPPVKKDQRAERAKKWKKASR